MLIAQDTLRISHYIRQGDGRWLSEEVTDRNTTLALECIGCGLRLAEIYEGVTFSSL